MRTRIVRNSAVLVGLCALATVLAFPTTSVAQPPPYQTMVAYTGEGEHPVSVIVDKAGNFWVSLQPICQVRQYAPDWQELTRIDLVSASDCTVGTGASGLAVDAIGHLYAAVVGSDDAVRGVYRVHRSGRTSKIPGTEQILFPNSIAFDPYDGTMYVTDMYGGAVWRVPRRGTAERWAADPMLYRDPRGWGGWRERPRDRPPLESLVPAVPGRGRGLGDLPGGFRRPHPDPMGRVGRQAEGGRLGGRLHGARAPGLRGRRHRARPVRERDGLRRRRGRGRPGVRRRRGGRAPGHASAPAVSLAFGTGKRHRRSLFVALNKGLGFGGEFSGIVKIDAAFPGRPMP